ncbi:MAG TPA: hypothetical protein VLT17_07610 [Gemmatimonadales bacterium]|jgi:uncharacterized membrane protein|nr:hypothetical protein [Gemmatimonadales bacterium]
MDHTTFAILRLIHVLSGVIWVGGVFFVSIYLMPTIRALGPAGAPVMQHLAQVKKIQIFFLVMSLTAILTGLAAFYHNSAGDSGWMRSGPGRTFSIGALFAILALIHGATVNSPTAKKIGILGTALQAAKGPPPADQLAEAQRLQDKLYFHTRVSIGLLLVATLAMGLARYVG